jgi:hypothetical protein
MSALTDAELAEIENAAIDIFLARLDGSGDADFTWEECGQSIRKPYLKVARQVLAPLLKEIARLRGIEERAKELLDNVAFCEGAECNEIARYILEGEGKVSEPDACHEKER